MTRQEWCVVLSFTLAYALLAIGKPVHIDDPVVLHVSNQILQNPFDPFGGEIDWFGYLQPTWSSTTNPPLLSYYLAPFVWISDSNDWVLHAAMLPFVVLLGAFMLQLTKRFVGSSAWPTAFLLASPAVLVSLNLMRDVPALALSTAAIAIYIRGVDEERVRDIVIGSILAGCAVLTKYAAGILLPLLVLYPLLQRKWFAVLGCVPAGVILLLWCGHNWILYGQVHVIYLALERRDDSGIPFQDKLYGAFLVLGCAVYVLPVALGAWLTWRAWWKWILLLLSVAMLAWSINGYLNGQTDYEYYLWALTGGGLVVVAILASVCTMMGQESGKRNDALFLLAWLAIPLLFAVIMVPFQAVRHLLPALPPLLLLLWLTIQPLFESKRTVVFRVCMVLLVVQGAIAGVLQLSDTAYAMAYKRFAGAASDRWISDKHETWYVGHWGWSHYAERAGIRQMRIGEWPQTGDIVIQPYRVVIGQVLRDDRFFFERQEILEQKEYTSVLPVRCQNFWGAGFYSVISIYGRNIPYRLNQDLYLERFTVYRVVEPHPLDP